MTIDWDRARAMRDEVAKWPAWKRQAARSAFQQPKEKQVSAELEGAALFQAAAEARGSIIWPSDPWVHVPLMLEWLRDRRWSVQIGQFEVDGIWRTTADAWPPFPRSGARVSGRCPDLPTALARLVLRVAELEGKS